MEQPKKEKRPWARIYLLGVRVLCLGVLAGAVWLMLSGHYIAAVVLGISSPILVQGMFLCPYWRTRLNPRQMKVAPHCLCPECKREL